MENYIEIVIYTIILICFILNIWRLLNRRDKITNTYDYDHNIVKRKKNSNFWNTVQIILSFLIICGCILIIMGKVLNNYL